MTNENGFLQRVLVNQRFGVDCSRLTIWEYLLLLEHTEKSEK